LKHQFLFSHFKLAKQDGAHEKRRGVETGNWLCYCQLESLMPFDAHVPSDGLAAPPSAPPLPNAESLPPQAAAGPEPSAIAPIWLQRTSLFVLVLFCVYLGVLVMVLPWWTKVWDHNLFIQSHPALAAVLRNGAVRGLISGLGLLDIWIGVSEAIHYRDHR
jgi:hypothetical protein